MSLVLEGLATALPGAPLPQSRFAEIAAPCCTTDHAQSRLLPALYRRTKVGHRHSVLNQSGAPGAGLAAFYRPPADPAAASRGPDLSTRMAAYEAHAPALAARAAAAALADAGRDAAEIQQLVVVSCTGFAAPGVDIALIDTLGLPAGVGRTHIGFMGCHGAMNGLRAAHGVSRLPPAAPAPDSAPNAAPAPAPTTRGLVLMVCVELCSLHFAYGWEPQRIVANALFGDGAAAVVGRYAPNGAGTGSACSGPRPAPRAAPPIVVDHASTVLAQGRDAMTWYVRNHGFEMTLSPTVPDAIGSHLPGWIRSWLKQHGLTPDAVGGWAIHPGGPRVVSATTAALGLPPAAGDPARAVLHNVGNCSSPTVLFILERLRAANVPRPWVGLAFGPGLSIEAVLIR